ncbi:MAG: DMT family transporter [Paracoccaceae bacterium]
MTPRTSFRLAVVGLGIGWGLTQPLGKIATGDGQGVFGLIFWQLVIGTVVLGTVALVRGRPIALSGQLVRFAVIVAVIGTLIPNTTFYLAVRELPAGIMSILISAVPLIAFPIALTLGVDRFSWLRLAGLLCGLAGVAVIALPEGALPDRAALAWLPVALVGPLFYAIEGNYVARVGTGGADPVAAMFLASLAGAAMALPVVIATGQWFLPAPPFSRAEWALVASSALHACLYAGYVWLAAAAGAVFAGQTAYIVTGSGVLWAMLLLGERFSGWVWLALALMLAGLFLVSPRRATDGAATVREAAAT